MRNKIFTTFLLLLGIMISTSIYAKLGSGGKGAEENKDMVVVVTPTSFDAEIASGLVFVDYWAPWCGPCRKMNPILKEVAEEYADKVKIAKMNVDHHKKFAFDNQIFSLPTIVVYKEGKELTRIMGAHSKEKLVEYLLYLSVD